MIFSSDSAFARVFQGIKLDTLSRCILASGLLTSTIASRPPEAQVSVSHSLVHLLSSLSWRLHVRQKCPTSNRRVIIPSHQNVNGLEPRPLRTLYIIQKALIIPVKNLSQGRMLSRVTLGLGSRERTEPMTQATSWKSWEVSDLLRFKSERNRVTI